MTQNTAPAPETPAPGPVEHTNPRSLRGALAVARLDESALGDLVILWTDWDNDGTNFPVEYLPKVIAALQAVQARIDARA